MYYHSPNNFKEFIKRCLLFKSDERIDFLLGVMAWIGILMIGFAVYKVIVIVIQYILR